MNTTRILITAALLVASASISFAGPGAQYWQQHRTPNQGNGKDTTPLASKSTSATQRNSTAHHAGCHGCPCKANG